MRSPVLLTEEAEETPTAPIVPNKVVGTHGVNDSIGTHDGREAVHAPALRAAPVPAAAPARLRGGGWFTLLWGMAAESVAALLGSEALSRLSDEAQRLCRGSLKGL